MKLTVPSLSRTIKSDYVSRFIIIGSAFKNVVHECDIAR